MQLSLVSVMGAAPKLDVVDCGPSAYAIGHDVVKLQEGPFSAVATIASHEGTTTAVADPHRPLDLGRDVT